MGAVKRFARIKHRSIVLGDLVGWAGGYGLLDSYNQWIDVGQNRWATALALCLASITSLPDCSITTRCLSTDLIGARTNPSKSGKNRSSKTCYAKATTKDYLSWTTKPSIHSRLSAKSAT